MEAADELLQLYRVETAVELKEEILRSLGVAEAVQPLVARSRRPRPTRACAAPRSRASASSTPRIPRRMLRSLYAMQKDAESKKAVMEALFVQDDAKALIEIAKAEKDPALRREAVEKLSLMDSREAQEYMLEILQK